MFFLVVSVNLLYNYFDFKGVKDIVEDWVGDCYFLLLCVVVQYFLLVEVVGQLGEVGGSQGYEVGFFWFGLVSEGGVQVYQWVVYCSYFLVEDGVDVMGWVWVEYQVVVFEVVVDQICGAICRFIFLYLFCQFVYSGYFVCFGFVVLFDLFFYLLADVVFRFVQFDEIGCFDINLVKGCQCIYC